METEGHDAAELTFFFTARGGRSIASRPPQHEGSRHIRPLPAGAPASWRPQRRVDRPSCSPCLWDRDWGSQRGLERIAGERRLECTAAYSENISWDSLKTSRGLMIRKKHAARKAVIFMSLWGDLKPEYDQFKRYQRPIITSFGVLPSITTLEWKRR